MVDAINVRSHLPDPLPSRASLTAKNVLSQLENDDVPPKPEVREKENGESQALPPANEGAGRRRLRGLGHYV